MALNLKLKAEKKEDGDVFLLLEASESLEDGQTSTSLGITLHGVIGDVKVQPKSLSFTNKEGAPIIMELHKPLSAPSL